MTSTTDPVRTARRRGVRDILIFGLSGGALIVVLKLTEYRFLVIEHSVEIYGALIAALFAGVGIWLGLTLTRRKETDAGHRFSSMSPAPFVRDDARLAELGITPRELIP